MIIDESACEDLIAVTLPPLPDKEGRIEILYEP